MVTNLQYQCVRVAIRKEVHARSNDRSLSEMQQAKIKHSILVALPIEPLWSNMKLWLIAITNE